MKKLFKLSALCLAVVLATGCALKEEYGINISKDKNVKLEAVMAFDDDAIDQMMGMENGSSLFSDDEEESKEETKTYTDKERWEFLENGGANQYITGFDDYEKTKYDKDGYKGYAFTLDLGDIDKLVADNADEVTMENLGKDAKFFTKKGDVYAIKLKLGANQSTQMESYSSIMKLDLNMKITLPTKAKTNNATEVKGNTYTWDLTKAKTIELSFDFNGAKSNNNTILIVGAACTIVAIGIGVYVFTKKKQK